jgi:hypothetical protein
MTTTTSRRAILAGIAAAPALAASAIALTGPETDPIFTAIERHKVAFRISQEAGRIQCHTVDVKWAPEYDPVRWKAVQEASSAADATAAAAANALTTVRPTTMAGVLALIRHVEAFNAGAFFLEPDPESTVSDWQSAPMFWPASEDEDGIDLWGYEILANVRRALEAMAVQS